MEQKVRRIELLGAPRHLVIAASLVIIIAGLRAASALLVPFLLAAFVAAICTVPLTWLRRRSVPDGLAVGVIAAGILALGSALAALVAVSLTGFLLELPKDEERLSALTSSAIEWLHAHGLHISRSALLQQFDLARVMSFVGGIVAGLSSALADGFIILITVIFILLETSSFPRKLQAALHEPEQPLAELREFNAAARRYLIIKTLLSVATGVAIGLWLWVLGVNHAFLLGFLAFLLNFVPYVGCYLAAVPALLLALVEQGVGPALLALLGYVAVHLVLGNLVECRLMGAQLGLSPLVVLASMALWGWVLGPVGMVLSVPLTVLLRIALESRPSTRRFAILLAPEPLGKKR